MFQDSICLHIPLNLTVDLGVALRRTRTKRIEALYQKYPDLKEKNESGEEEDDEQEEDEEEGESDAEMEEGEEGAEKKEKKKQKKKEKNSKKKSNLVPQRHEFGSIMDYLEAKYVRGVMIENEKEKAPKGSDEEGDDDASAPKPDDDEGQGSVYSESSFLDDRDLQRDVAEQVLAQTTTTKLELEGDDDFFVNVGDLDVEETELTQQHYDPLEDSEKKVKTPTKKRKKPSGDGAAAKKTGAASPPAKKKAAVTKKKKKEDEKEKGKGSGSGKSKPSPKKKKPVVSTKKPKLRKEKEKEESGNESESSSEGAAVVVAASSKKAVAANTTKKPPEEMKELKKEAGRTRAIMMKRFDTVKKMIKELTKEQLPRRPPLKSKVSITCPANKKEGDEVTFANPHIPGQRLRVQVPKGTFAGETFKVTVPVPKPSAGDDDEGVDHNKFPRLLQDELDMYAREYDIFCKHEGDYRHAKDEEFPIHLEKRKKYDQVVKEFPKNLMTPIDSEYMKKLVRRARQNKSKRTKSAAVRRASGDNAATAPEAATSSVQPDKSKSQSSPPPAAPAPAPPTPPVPSDNEQDTAADNESDAEEEPEPSAPEPPTHRTIALPERGVVFPRMQFNTMDFFQAGGGPGSQS